jgi:hypothetical protein
MSDDKPNAPSPPTPREPASEDIDAKLERAEARFLIANGWVLNEPGIEDPEGDMRKWASPEDPSILITHDQAMARQKVKQIAAKKDKRDKEKGKKK